MNSSEAADTPPKRGTGKKRRFLSAEKKFQVFLEAQHSPEPIGEILRREGLYSTDLARIRQQVREGAIQRLGAKPGRRAEVVSADSYEELKRELQQKERALADLAVELAILRKKRMGGRGTDSRSPDRRANQAGHAHRDCDLSEPRRIRPAQLLAPDDRLPPGRALARVPARRAGFGRWDARPQGSLAPTAARGGGEDYAPGLSSGVC
jgi:transposase-like protein